MVFQNHKSRFFRVRRGVPQRSVFRLLLFSLFIKDLPASLPSSVSCFLYANDLAIWSSSPTVPTAVVATLEALIRLECCFEYGVFLSIRANMRHLLNGSPPSYSPAPPFLIQLSPPSQSHSNFSWGHFRPPSSSLVSRPYAVSLLPHGGPSKEFLSSV